MDINLQQAARALVVLSRGEREKILKDAENARLHEKETAKSHPLHHGKFSAEELQQLKAHMLDGGGVQDDEYLRRIVIQALLDED